MWQVENGIAEWWDGEDTPKLVIRLPEGFSFTDTVRDMVECAYWRGRDVGEACGRMLQQHDIQRTLGLSQ